MGREVDADSTGTEPAVDITLPGLEESYAPHVGDVCRSHDGHPARYIGWGKALYLSGDDLAVHDAIPPREGESVEPLPTDDQVQAASAAVRHYED